MVLKPLSKHTYNGCRCILLMWYYYIFLGKEETPDYTPGIKQFGNAKISFKDDDYFKKVKKLSQSS